MFPWLSLSDVPLILADDPVPPTEVWVPSADPAPVPTPSVVPEDAFPTAAELDAIFAEASARPPGPDLALRQEVVALLGLDAAVAEDPAAYDAALAALAPEPAPDPVSDVPAPALDWEAMSRDWGDLSRGWILG